MPSDDLCSPPHSHCDFPPPENEFHGFHAVLSTILSQLVHPEPAFGRWSELATMNFELIELDILHVEAYQIKEVLKVSDQRLDQPTCERSAPSPAESL